MIEIKVSDLQIQSAVQDAIRRAVDHELSGRYSSQGILSAAIQKALNASSAELQGAVRQAALAALQSPELQEQLKTAFSKKIASLFVGEYEGTLKAMARKAAQVKNPEEALLPIVEGLVLTSPLEPKAP